MAEQRLAGSVVANQEHHARLGDEANSLAAWCADSGWAWPVIGGALDTGGGGTSGGTMLLAPRGVGHQCPPGAPRHEVWPGRCVGALLYTYLLGGITVFSIYAETGNGFPTGINPELFDALWNQASILVVEQLGSVEVFEQAQQNSKDFCLNNNKNSSCL